MVGTMLPIENLDRSNYASWSYRMHQYLLGHGYRSYVDGANDATPEMTHRDFSYVVDSRYLSRILCFSCPKLSIKLVFGFLFPSSFRTLYFYMVLEREG